MKYLVSDHRAGAVGKERWAAINTPVVPNFPTGEQNTFLGTVDYLPVPYARVAALDISLDDIAGRLKKQYPGLPGALLDTYVFEVAKTVLHIPIGTLCQIYITDDEAKIKLVDTDIFYTLWRKQPIPAGYA